MLYEASGGRAIFVCARAGVMGGASAVVSSRPHNHAFTRVTPPSHLLHQPPRGAFLQDTSHRQTRPLGPATWRLLTAAKRARAERKPVRLLLCWLILAPRSFIHVAIVTISAFFAAIAIGRRPGAHEDALRPVQCVHPCLRRDEHLLLLFYNTSICCNRSVAIHVLLLLWI